MESRDLNLCSRSSQRLRADLACPVGGVHKMSLGTPNKDPIINR